MQALLDNPTSSLQWRMAQVKFRAGTVIYLIANPKKARSFMLTDKVEKGVISSDGYKNIEIDTEKRAIMMVEYFKASQAFHTRPQWVYTGSIPQGFEYIQVWEEKRTGTIRYIKNEDAAEYVALAAMYDDITDCTKDAEFDAEEHEVRSVD